MVKVIIMLLLMLLAGMGRFLKDISVKIVEGKGARLITLPPFHHTSPLPSEAAMKGEVSFGSVEEASISSLYVQLSLTKCDLLFCPIEVCLPVV